MFLDAQLTNNVQRSSDPSLAKRVANSCAAAESQRESVEARNQAVNQLMADRILSWKKPPVGNGTRISVEYLATSALKADLI